MHQNFGYISCHYYNRSFPRRKIEVALLIVRESNAKFSLSIFLLRAYSFALISVPFGHHEVLAASSPPLPPGCCPGLTMGPPGRGRRAACPRHQEPLGGGDGVPAAAIHARFPAAQRGVRGLLPAIQGPGDLPHVQVGNASNRESETAS